MKLHAHVPLSTAAARPRGRVVGLVAGQAVPHMALNDCQFLSTKILLHAHCACWHYPQLRLAALWQGAPKLKTEQTNLLLLHRAPGRHTHAARVRQMMMARCWPQQTSAVNKSGRQAGRHTSNGAARRQQQWLSATPAVGCSGSCSSSFSRRLPPYLSSASS